MTLPMVLVTGATGFLGGAAAASCYGRDLRGASCSWCAAPTTPRPRGACGRRWRGSANQPRPIPSHPPAKCYAAT